MAQVSMERDPQTSKLKRTTFYAKTYQTAAERLAKALRERQQGLFVAPTNRLLGEWRDTWLQNYKQPILRSLIFYGCETVLRQHLQPTSGHFTLQSV